MHRSRSKLLALGSWGRDVRIRVGTPPTILFGSGASYYVLLLLLSTCASGWILLSWPPSQSSSPRKLACNGRASMRRGNSSRDASSYGFTRNTKNSFVSERVSYLRRTSGLDGTKMMVPLWQISRRHLYNNNSSSSCKDDEEGKGDAGGCRSNHNCWNSDYHHPQTLGLSEYLAGGPPVIAANRLKALHRDFIVQEIRRNGSIVPLVTAGSEIRRHLPREYIGRSSAEIMMMMNNTTRSDVGKVKDIVEGESRGGTTGVMEKVVGKAAPDKTASWSSLFWLLFTVSKYGMSTFEMVNRLANTLGVHEHHIKYNGMKDAYAITAQEISIPSDQINDIKDLFRVKLRQARIGDLHLSSKPCKLGSHGGNCFTITLKNVTCGVQWNQGGEERISKAINSWKNEGFINYYGQQRFTNTGMDLVGRYYLCGDYRAALSALLLPCLKTGNGLNNQGESVIQSFIDEQKRVGSSSSSSSSGSRRRRTRFSSANNDDTKKEDFEKYDDDIVEDVGEDKALQLGRQFAEYMVYLMQSGMLMDNMMDKSKERRRTMAWMMIDNVQKNMNKMDITRKHTTSTSRFFNNEYDEDESSSSSSSSYSNATNTATPRNHRGHHRLIEAICRASFLQIPYRHRMMAISAYNSKVWNHIASERIRLFGVAVAKGDLLSICSNRSNPTPSTMSTKPVYCYSEEEVEEEQVVVVARMPQGSIIKANSADDTTRSRREEEDIDDDDDDILKEQRQSSSSSYSIFDIVLTLAGEGQQFPHNVVGDIHREFLSRDGTIDAWRVEGKMRKRYLRTAHYRALFRRPSNVSWTASKDDAEYKPQKQQYRRRQRSSLSTPSPPQSLSCWCSELDKRDHRGTAATTCSHSSSSCIKLRFSLGSGEFATVAMRELFAMSK